MLYLKFKLSNIKIKNFLSYKDAEFENLKDYNVLIGKNNAGKSNLFRLLKFLCKEFNFKLSNEFHSDLLFNKDTNSLSLISLIFRLSEDFRVEIFKQLYKANYLRRVFNKNEVHHGFLKSNEWTKEEIAINWLLKEGFLHSIQITFNFNQSKNSLFISEISGIHKRFEIPIPFFQTEIKNESQLYVKSLLNNQQSNSVIFSEFFGGVLGKMQSKEDSNMNLKQITRKLYAKDYCQNCDMLNLIFIEFYDYFINSISHISADRHFYGSDFIEDISNEGLDEVGRNFEKYIFQQENDPIGKTWMKELNEEVKNYFPTLRTLSQRYQNKRTEFYVLETNHDVIIDKSRMGSAFMHLSFILAFLKNIKPDAILLIEEPELFMFPGLQKKILDKFMSISDNIQIFITTHSRYFLSKNDDICSVYSIQKLNDESIAYKIPREDFSEIYKDMDSVLDEYESEQNLIYNDSLWVKFVEKAIDRDEDQLWDFKEFLEWWHPDCTNKEEKQVKFCEIVSAFANAKGGLIIIGITDKKPPQNSRDKYQRKQIERVKQINA
ncbi:hypothetical protein ES703_51356 [subsurface metagenome]